MWPFNKTKIISNNISYEIILSDGINWIDYIYDQSELWLRDYPNSEYHGGGEPRIRKIDLSNKSKILLLEYLRNLTEYRANFPDSKKLIQSKIDDLNLLIASIIDKGELSQLLLGADRNYGWSFIPGDEGEKLENSYWKFSDSIKTQI